MSTIGNLAVNVTANTENFSRGMKSARNEGMSFSRVAESMTLTLSHLALGFTAGFTIHRFIHDVEAANESLIDLGHSAKRLGAGSEGLGGLEHAGALFHVSNETLIKDLTFMEKNLGKNADAFGKLGLSVYELKQMQADQAFVKIVGALDQLPTAADKTAAAMAIFGKGGAEMLKMIMEGKEGLQSAIEEAHRMGLAPNEEQIKQIEKEDQAIQRLKESYHGLATTAGLSMTHRVTVLADNVNRLLGGDTTTQPKWQKFVDEMSKKEFEQIQRDIKTLPSGHSSAEVIKNRFGWDRGGNDITEFNTAMARRDERERVAAEKAAKEAIDGTTLWCDEAGLAQCSAHGLRKVAAVRLAEAGGPPHLHRRERRRRVHQECP